MMRLGAEVGRYRILERIGEGGMGDVYRAAHGALGSPVAIKFLNRRRSEDPTYLERLRREAVAMANLNHPGIARVIDVGAQPDGTRYVVMEYLEGETLHQRLDRIGALWPAEAIAIAIDVADALSAAHDQGIVHRDLKPANVFLARTASRLRPYAVKLLDFGIARRTDDLAGALTASDVVLGTPYYMAPEQWSTTRVDARADLYAFGAVLYEMLTGSPPFDGADWLEVRDGHMTRPPAPPSERAGAERCPPDLDALILKLLAKAAEDRPASLADVLPALARLLEQARAVPLPAGPTAGASPLLARSRRATAPAPGVVPAPAGGDPLAGAGAATPEDPTAAASAAAAAAAEAAAAGASAGGSEAAASESGGVEVDLSGLTPGLPGGRGR